MSSSEGGVALRVHGGVSLDELASAGVDARETIDFSASINPYGPCAAVVQAVRSCSIDRYPDPTATALRRALAAVHHTCPDRVVIGNGAADLLWTLARVLVRPGATVIVAEPTFAEFRDAALAADGRIAAAQSPAEAGFAVDVEAIEKLAFQSGARVIYLASPNTPVGTRVPVERVAALARRLGDVTVVLDQAFVTLSDHPDDEAVPVPPNVVRVRSLTKDHAIAGLRLGYLMASPELARRVEACRAPWTTSAVAQAAGLAAVGAQSFVEESRGRLLGDRDALVSSLKSLGVTPLPSTACFFAFAVADATQLRRRLLARGILVRDCSSFGMPGFVRVAARPAADRERLMQALREELSTC